MRTTAILPAFLCLLATAMVPATAQQRLVDDFSSGTDAQWTRLDLLQAAQQGSTLYSVVNGRYRLASSQSVPTGPTSAATASYHTVSGLVPSLYADGVLRLLVHMENATTNVLIAMRAQPGPTGGSGFMFSLNNYENRLYISFYTPSGSANLVSVPFAIAAQADYLVEAGCLGNRLTLKAWQAGTPEPATPQLVTRNNMFVDGAIAVGLYSQPSIGGMLAGQFDDVTFTPYPVVTSHGSACSGGSSILPMLDVEGHPVRGGTLQLVVQRGAPNGLAAMVFGATPGNLAIGLPCNLLVDNLLGSVIVGLDIAGDATLSIPLPTSLPPMSLDVQALTTTLQPALFAATRGMGLFFQP